MDFTDLANTIKEYIRPGSTAIRDPHDPSTTYGPAQSRFTRTNQQFINDPTSSQSGQYLTAPKNIVTSAFPGVAPVEQINVASPDTTSVKGAIRHEDAHALLKDLSMDQLKTLSDNNPMGYTVEGRLASLGRAGYGPQEAPAYMAEGDPKATYNVPSDIRNIYLSHMYNQLGAINPQLAQKYQQLVGK
jgi:hypothetical protein